MKLLELITYFRMGGSYESFCKKQSLDIESEVVEIYMEKPFDLDNDLSFFEIEKTDGKIEYGVNGIKYYNLFDFYYFLDAIEESNSDKNKSLSENEIAKRFLSYAINNA